MIAHVQTGMAVRGPDGEKIGKVIATGVDQLLIGRGLLSPRDYLVREDQIAGVERGALRLRVPLARLEHWDATRFHPGAASADTPTELKLYEEELVAQKHLRVAGHVRVTKRIVTEKKTITVEVRREVFEVERVASAPTAARAEDRGSRSASLAPPGIGAPMEEATVDLPLYEDEIEIVRRPKLKEVVRVRKSLATEEKTFSDTVRREDATVDTEGRVHLTNPPPVHH